MLSAYLYLLIEKLHSKQKATTIVATVGDLLGVTEHTVWAWKKQFLENDGSFPEAEAPA